MLLLLYVLRDSEENQVVFMDKLKNIFGAIIGVIRKIKVWRIVALVVVVAILYQVLTTVMMCNVVLDWDKLSQSPQASEIIITDLSAPKYKDWLKASAEDEYVENDGLKLHALSLTDKKTSHSYVVICHPATCSAEDMAEYAYHFYDLGFNVILPDARGCGQSEGDNITFGVKDAEDLPLWINKLTDLDPQASIFLFGVGMGGSAVCLAAGEELPANVKGVIEDSGFNNLEDVFKENIKKLYNKNKFPSLLFADLYFKSVQGWSFKDVKVSDSIEKASVPMLFIHGGDDRIVPVDQSNDLYEICQTKGSDHLYMTGAAHCRPMHTNPEKYWRIVDSFLLENM